VLTPHLVEANVAQQVLARFRDTERAGAQMRSDPFVFTHA